LTSWLISLPSDAMIEAKAREATARDEVIHFALKCASDQFRTDGNDPGWESEMHDDFLRNAVHEYVGEMNFVKELKKTEQAEAVLEIERQQRDTID